MFWKTNFVYPLWLLDFFVWLFSQEYFHIPKCVNRWGGLEPLCYLHGSIEDPAFFIFGKVFFCHSLSVVPWRWPVLAFSQFRWSLRLRSSSRPSLVWTSPRCCTQGEQTRRLTSSKYHSLVPPLGPSYLRVTDVSTVCAISHRTCLRSHLCCCAFN